MASESKLDSESSTLGDGCLTPAKMPLQSSEERAFHGIV